MRKVIFGAVLIVVISGMVCAQETTGRVRTFLSDSGGVGLAGVQLKLNNAEIGLTRSAVSNAAGIAVFPALPPGVYLLAASSEGMMNFEESVRVRAGAETSIRIRMKPETSRSVIRLDEGEAPMDLSSTTTGRSFSVEDLNSRIPVRRTASDIALLVPSVVAGDSAFDGLTPGQNNISISGASVAENAYFVNGLNITNFRNGLGSTMVPVEFLDELQVITGGWEAAYGRSTGGILNMVTKSGTNTLHGRFSLYWEPEDLQEQSPDTYFSPNSDESLESLEINASIGGPAIRDRLFYFGFLRYSDNDVLNLSYTQGTRSTVSDPYWGFKLDWNIRSGHRLEGSFISDDVRVDRTIYEYIPGGDWSPGEGNKPSGGHLGDKLGRGAEDRGGDNFVVTYSGILKENLMLSAEYGRNRFTRSNSSPAENCPYAFDLRGGGYIHMGCWVNWSRGSASDEREAWRVDADYYLGSHSFRSGIDSESNSSWDLVSYSGGVRYGYYDDADSSTGATLNVRHYENGGFFDVDSDAAYIQDSWALNPTLSLNIGLRLEKFENMNSAGRTFLETSDQIAPRLGLIWDPTGEGNSKVYASAGRYFLPIPSTVNIRMAGGEIYDSAYYEWDPAQGYARDGTPVGYVDCGPLNLENCANQGSVGNLLSSVVYSDGEPPDPRATSASHIDPMSQDEFIIGWEESVGDNWSLGVRGVWREFNRIIEDFSLDQALITRYGMDVGYGAFAYRIGNPGSSFSGYFDIDGDGILDPVHFSAEELGYPEPERNYGALEFSFKRRFSGRWMLQGSYTYSHLYGNYEGMVYSDIGQDDAGLTQIFDFPGLMENSRGNLPQDRRHNLKVFGSYAFDSGLQLGGNLLWHSGRPISAIGIYPDPDNPAYLYDSAAYFDQGQPVPRGSVGRTPPILNLDAMVKYDFVLLGFDMNVRVDVFNLLDADTATEVDEFADQNSGARNPHYRAPTHFQEPRRIRIGFGMSF